MHGVERCACYCCCCCHTDFVVSLLIPRGHLRSLFLCVRERDSVVPSFMMLTSCFCSSAEEIEQFAAAMLGSRLITKQTGSQGRRCDKVGWIVVIV